MVSSNFNTSEISDIEKDESMVVEKNEFNDQVSLLLPKQILNPLSSILMQKTFTEEFFEVPPNR